VRELSHDGLCVGERRAVAIVFAKDEVNRLSDVLGQLAELGPSVSASGDVTG
jgi:hypothetical protein